MSTYSQIHLQVVFAVKNRQSLLKNQWRDEVCKYISGIIKNKEQKSIIVNGVEDHLHILLGLRPSMCIADLIRDIKNNSSKYINDRKLITGKFAWQEGYAVFSYSQSQVEKVYNYINNQKEHHKKVTFKEEYIEFLKKFQIEYNDKYLFDWMEKEGF